ncbi:hypothetical protein BDW02DRAFT_572322 [Decorospora gaudefroyi]|uniref:Uncharacterized protein n=1 Tax=Decorospora gaudefroyi TaxID=184978 RepID=A0A6A5K9N3_9PLEO|nr:hypothetical protein BDW02DRAFT_572322 [Decorospora gaudefroyi]
MTTPTLQDVPLSPEQRQAQEQRERYDRMTRNVAIGGLILCPALILLPPRKLDLYTYALGLGFYLSADHLCKVRTGLDIIDQLGTVRFTRRLPTERAEEMHKVLQEERDKGRRPLERKDPGAEKEEKGIFGRIWMGDETEGWKERRLEEERRAVAEGKSYTDVIMEQIWEVWNWDKKKDGKDDEEKKE